MIHESYYKEHSRCPKCGHVVNIITDAPTFVIANPPDLSKCLCSNCAWRGVVDELVRAVEVPAGIHKPSIPFSSLKTMYSGEKAMPLIQSLSEDQAKYALWCVLALLFGDSLSNAAELLMARVPNIKSMAEAHFILAQIGFPSQTQAIEQLRKELEPFLKQG